MLIDSHCHLHNAELFPGEAKEYIARARSAGVQQLVVVGTSCEDSLAAQNFAKAQPGVFWTYGVHPENCACPAGEIEFDERLIAIGEAGLDYHYNSGGHEAQWALLEEMLDLGLKKGLPFCFHVREAFDDFFAIIDNFEGVTGVLHSFTDNKKNLAKCLERGFYIGVNGMATYSTLPRPPLERMLLETDAPYLAPVPHRGEVNEPAYIREIAEWVAREWGVSLEDVAEATSNNFRSVYRLSASDSRA